MKGAALFFIFFFSTVIAEQTSPHINVYVKEHSSLGTCDFRINVLIKINSLFMEAYITALRT